MGKSPFERFEKDVRKNSYLFPFSAMLLMRNEEDEKALLENPHFPFQEAILNWRAFNDYKKDISGCDIILPHEWYSHYILKLVEHYKKAPAVECMIGWEFYIPDAFLAVERYREKDPRLVLKPCSKENYRRFSSMNDDTYIDYLMENDPAVIDLKDALSEDQRRKVAKDIAMVEPRENHQPLLELTDKLPKSIKNCGILKKSVKNGRIIYGIIAPTIDKWKRDRNGDIILNEKGVPAMINMSDEVKFYSLLCAPHKERWTDKPLDLRFISDMEILCGEGIYGIDRNEIEKIREEVNPEEGYSVYMMTAKPEDAFATVKEFARLHNSMKEEGVTGLIPLFQIDEKLDAIRAIASKYGKWGDLLYDEKQPARFSGPRTISMRNLLEILKDTTHDKVPHSYVGSILKNGEITAIEAILFKNGCPHLDKEYYDVKEFKIRSSHLHLRPEMQVKNEMEQAKEIFLQTLDDWKERMSSPKNL